jgi:asparagine synthase (glutamine-hydrolysing)
MDNIIQVGIYSQPHHFLGYWGDGQRNELETLLSKAISYKCSDVDNFSSPENHIYPIWNVAYIQGSQLNSPKISFLSDINLSSNTIAAISAGLSKDADAWVRIGKEDSLILGREPFGRVPLYWMQQEQIIWFASRLQLLLPLIEPQVSTSALYSYSCFSYVPTPLTPVNNISAIPAGTELIWHRQPTERRPTGSSLLEWCQADEQITDEATAVVQLQKLLKEAIDSQITDLNEPVGVFLSGGLDSSIVAALLVQAGVKVRGYTLDFGSVGIPEYPYAEQVAQFLQIPLVKVQATPNLIKKALIPTVKALDLPFGDGVTVPLYLLCEAASQETSIIFNGEGGDQLFAGWTNKPLIAAGVYETAAEEKFIQQYLRTFHRLWGLETQVYQPELYTEILNISCKQWLQVALDSKFCPSFMHRLRRASLMLKGAQNIHPRATALGFAHGLNVRSPFCDLALAQWTFGVSGELFLQGACEKYILKKAVENWLPLEIVWRQKRGMGVPLTSWCFNEFWRLIGTWLNPGVLRQQKCFDPQIAAKIVSGELSATIQGRRIGEILWLLIMWQLWRSHVLGEQPDKSLHPFLLPRWLWRRYKQWQQ